MKELAITLPDGAQVRKTADGRMSVFDLLKIAGAKNPRDTFARLEQEYPEVVGSCDNFKFSGQGQRKTPVTTEAGWRQIKMVLPGVIGAAYRTAASDLIESALRGDVRTAAAIVDRNTNAADLQWIGARALSKSTVIDLNAAICAAGVTQNIYAIVANSNNVFVTGMTADQIREERGVKQTRDGLDVVELGLLIALQGSQAKKIRESNVRGNGGVLDVVFQYGQKIAALRKELIGPVNYPKRGLLTVTL